MKLNKILPLIGVIIFVYLIYRIGFNEIISAFAIQNIVPFIAALIVMVFIFLVQTLKWQSILKLQGYKIPFFKLFKIHLISYFYGLITPAKAGTLIRINYIKKITKDSLAKSSSNTIIDKILDFSVVLTLGFLGVLFFIQSFVDFIWLFVVLLVIFIAASLILLKKERTEQILRFFYRFLLPKKYKAKAKHYFYDFYSNFPKRRKLIIPLILTAITWILIYSLSYFLGLSIGIDLPYHYFILLFPITTILAMIPISPSGLGIREVTLIGLFGQYGIASELLIALSILTYITNGVIPAFFGWIFSMQKKV
tara:strand:- start:1006 stop:1932 length:927 start_codon:yes stop_codon:yes gene_type:complete